MTEKNAQLEAGLASDLNRELDTGAKNSKTRYLKVSKIGNKHIRCFVIILTLPFMIVINCVFITVAAVRQMFVTNAKTVRTAIEKSI